ncbi:hypothetical protein M3152_10300 [Sporosarcina luteola]|uniref:hypothetical protein n=1 Tax=Bacillales TaxID=1385 RepID=UPI00203EE594|nr:MULTISPECIES: hypothetical protein [Bacillales]MCM3638116.1 hypothetical protein [Sporosarcina luteola]
MGLKSRNDDNHRDLTDNFVKETDNFLQLIDNSREVIDKNVKMIDNFICSQTKACSVLLFGRLILFFH